MNRVIDEIIIDFANAWRSLNPELIIKHLSPDFRYDSQWVFESLDYNRYINYISSKFNLLRDNGISIRVNIIINSSTGEKALQIFQSEEPIIYRIQVRDGMVIKGDLCMF